MFKRDTLLKYVSGLSDGMQRILQSSNASLEKKKVAFQGVLHINYCWRLSRIILAFLTWNSSWPEPIGKHQ